MKRAQKRPLEKLAFRWGARLFAMNGEPPLRTGARILQNRHTDLSLAPITMYLLQLLGLPTQPSRYAHRLRSLYSRLNHPSDRIRGRVYGCPLVYKSGLVN